MMVRIFTGAASAVALSTAAVAQSGASGLASPIEQGGWAVSGAIGVSASIGGDVHGGADAPIEDLGALNPDLAGVASELQIEERSFDDIYDSGIVLDAEIAYGLSDSDQVFGALRYTRLDEGSTQVGVAAVPALEAALPVQGEFGAYEATSVEAGYRRFFGSGGVRPYGAVRAGVTRVGSIDATFIIPIPDALSANDIVLQDVAFYDSTTTYSIGGEAGVLFTPNARTAVGVEVGLRYTGELDGDDAAIGGLGLAAINEVGDRLEVPVLVRGIITF